MLKLRYGMSAYIRLGPPLTLLSFRSTRWEACFRAQPYNNSYDAIFIAAMAGIGATSLCAIVLSERLNVPRPMFSHLMFHGAMHLCCSRYF